MSGVNKSPVFFTKEEAGWYERTPKKVIFAILRDFAYQEVGITIADEFPEKVLEVIRNRQETIQCAVYDDASEQVVKADRG